VRFPGGFRLNLSGRGLGYSWGFRGFRIGRDSRGRTLRTVSIPGTGIYNRQYLTSGNPRSEPSDGGCGGFLVAICVLGLIAGVLAIFSNGGNATGLLILMIIGIGGAIAWRRLPRTAGQKDQSVQVSESDYISLGHDVRILFTELAVPVKMELRKSGGASAYENIFEMALIDLICRFAALDGIVHPSEAKVFLDIFQVLHPNAYRGLSAQNAVAILEGYLQRNPNSTKEAMKDSLLFSATKRAGNMHAVKLEDVMYEVARQVALADGPLTMQEQAELAAIRSAPANGPPANKNSGGVVQEPVAISEHRPELLGPEVKNLYNLLAIPVKNELRKSRGATAYDDIFTTDFMELVWRFSSADGVVKPEEAKVFLGIHQALHPRRPLGIENVVRLLEGYPQRNPASLQQPIQESLLLRLVRDADRITGTMYTNSLAAVMYKVAEQVALADGPLTAQEQDELDALRAAFRLGPLDQRVALSGQRQNQQPTAFCTACGQQLPQGFAFCIHCGAKLETPAIPAPSTSLAAPLHAPTVDQGVGTKPLMVSPVGWLIAVLIGAVALIKISTAIFGAHETANVEPQVMVEEQERREAEAAFNSMTAAEHLEKAKLALKSGSTLEAIIEGLRNLVAIPPSAPEAATAKTLKRKLTRAQNLAIVRSRDAVPPPKKEPSTKLPPADSCEPYRSKYGSLNVGDRWTKIGQVLGRPTKMEDTAGGNTIFEYEFGECRLVFRAGTNNTLIAKQAHPPFRDSLR
jgi:tellurite resistance protein/uncharacterized membrane protein YeaQ/YmgE (transglycosylase-associated protein family)